MQKERIYAVLVGCCYGDAFGMPTEGLSLQAIRRQCPQGIDRFYPSMNAVISQRSFAEGTITDDSIHTLLLARELAQQGAAFDGRRYVEALARWYRSDPQASLVIGPSTLAAIRDLEQDGDHLAANHAVTNGCMMKIAPVGLLADTKESVRTLVYEVCRYTHRSNVALSASCVIAYLVARFCAGDGIEHMEALTEEMLAESKAMGFDFPSPDLLPRIRMAWQIAEESKEMTTFMETLYRVIGTGSSCIETLPAVLAIVRFTKGDVRRCASICASIGGDTDTLGAIACSLCGALGSLPFAQEIHMLETVNHLCFEEETQRLWDRQTAAAR